MARIKFGMMAAYSHYEGNFEKMFSDAAEIGIDSLMINIHATDEFKAKMLADAPIIKKYSEQYGVEINALWASWGAPCVWNFYEGQNTIGLIPPEYRDRRMQRVLNASEIGQALGVKYIVTHCGYIPENPLDPVYTSFISMMKYVCGVMKTRDQWFCLETGQETPITLLRTIQDIGTGNVGLNLDTANVILYGKANPVDAIKIVGDYVKCLHLKDGKWPTDGHNLGEQVQIGEGDVDFPAVIKGLNDHGYRGHFTIERERGDTDERKRDILESKNMFMDLTAQYEWDPE
ncbi:MAG: sugar phosphate isomerase/epimerase [Ruminococcaceae bacterium]|nr:sugar phosphate isomerase/epimerase [Oscillospiraceae bacterium]